jgi:hypothetical protein
MAALKNAAGYYGMDDIDSSLSILLDSRLTKRNRKSARNLRNGIVHQWKEGDCREVTARYSELQACFTKFSEALRRMW